MAMRVSRSGGVRSAIRPHSNRERSRSSRVVIAFGGRSERQHDLLAGLVDGVEGVEELLLGPLALGDELDVVDQQHVDAAISVPEVLHLLLADGVDEVVGELLGGGVQDPLARELDRHRVADGVHQVRLAQPHAAVQEERVVGVPRPLGHRQGGRVGQAVGRADDEVGERVAAVQVDRVAAGGAWRGRQAVLVALGRDSGPARRRPRTRPGPIRPPPGPGSGSPGCGSGCPASRGRIHSGRRCESGSHRSRRGWCPSARSRSWRARG